MKLNSLFIEGAVYDLMLEETLIDRPIAEALWCGRAKPGYGDFRGRMKAQRPRLLREGLNCAPVE